MATDDVIFQPLVFKNLTVKNRIFRSNIAGRLDNYDGSGNQARINWEVKFAKGGVGAIISSFVPVLIHGPDHAQLRHDRQRRAHPVLAGGRRGGPPSSTASYILQLSHGGRQRDIPGVEYPMGLSSTDKEDPLHGFECQRMTLADIHETVERVRRRRPPRPRGRAGRRRAARGERLSHHAVPELGHQRSDGRVRRIAREPRAFRARHRQGDSGESRVATSTCR